MNRERYQLVLEHTGNGDPHLALRLLLKQLGRSAGFRCVSMAPVGPATCKANADKAAEHAVEHLEGRH